MITQDIESLRTENEELRRLLEKHQWSGLTPVPAIYLGVPLRAPAQPTPLRTRNYRLYFSGQLVSVPGTWLQTVAQAWLVLTLSSSGSALGVTVALQTVPVLVLGAWTGSVADAVDKRKLLIGTQAAQGLLALVLGILALTGVVELWMVWILALGLGVARSFDTPTRQAFVSELVQVRRCRGRSGSTRPWCPRRA